MIRHRRSLFRKNILIGAVLAVSMIDIVHAHHLITGNDLMQRCIAAPDSFCAGYIGGVVDTSHALFCVPPEVGKREIINMTIMYLRDHPKKLGLYAPNLVIHAMGAAFPCKDGW